MTSFKSDISGHIIDWLIFNAGLAEVVALDWMTIIEQFISNPILLFTLPQYLIERVGSMSEDGIGSIFQANVFGHYYIVCSLLHQKLISAQTFGPIINIIK